jgi:indolepyruvate ferredoxin oxidoreductase beta subunit
MSTRPISILIGALGGEGGGVLSNWLVTAAAAADLPVQSTSVPGVAQRTGATTYYVEIFPETAAVLAGRKPILSLYPGVGDVDLVVASELLEAARAAENGFVAPERTVLIAATHRIYSVQEKTAMADGRVDTATIIKAIRAMAQRALLFDLTRSATHRRLPLNAVLLGAIAGSGLLPIAREHYESAIRASGIAVDANLAGFTAGFKIGRDGPGAEILPGPVDHRGNELVPAANLARLMEDAGPAVPAALLPIVQAALARLVDYQDLAYAQRYLGRLARVHALPGATPALLEAVARHLALWMSYEDVIRVGQLKSAPGRYQRIREEADVKGGQPIRVVEFFKPGVEEISALLPPWAGKRLYRWAERRDLLRRLHISMHINSSSVSGFARLWLLARLRRWRPHSYRWAQEQARIEQWLDAVCAAAAIANEFAVEVALCPKVLKGYSDTQRRGLQNYLAIREQVILPAIATRRNAAASLRQVREAALADPDGERLEAALRAAVAEHEVRPAAPPARRAVEQVIAASALSV